MANISDLTKSITDLPYEQSYNLIRDIRAFRRMLKPVKERKAKEVKAKKPLKQQLTLDDMLKGISKKDAAALFAKLTKQS